MEQGPDNKRRQILRLMAIAVGMALLANGIVWALRVPPLHPADESQHYLYASQFDGVSPEQPPEKSQVPRDLQALAELAEFGPHREVRETIDLSEARTDEIKRLTKEADNPGLATVYVEDKETHFLQPHEGFYDYHPPVYYAVTGQVLRLGHVFGFGVRGRLLMARLFSVAMSMVAILLIVLVARGVWPNQWGFPTLIGLAVSWQGLVAFKTSSVNNEALTFLLFSAFLYIGTRVITLRPSAANITGLFGIAFVAVCTKISMLALFPPLSLFTLAFAKTRRWLRITIWSMIGVFFGVAFAWLLIPLGGGESMIESYTELDPEPRSFPVEMFQPGRIWDHIAIATQNWGRTLGNATHTDARVSNKVYYCYMTLSGIALLSGLVLLFKKARAMQRRMLIWLGLAPLMVLGLFYSIDYRFASLSGGWFLSRPQYFIPTAAAQMIWFVWGLSGWFRGKILTVLAGLFTVVMMAFNIWVLTRVVSLRYFEFTGWWGQCDQIALLWPVPTWSVVAADIFAVLTSAAAAAMVIVCIRSESRLDNPA